MKKTMFFVLLLIATTCYLQAQTEETKVTEVVNNLFKAMHTNDTTLFKSVFADQVSLSTVGNRGGTIKVQSESNINGFLKAIAKPNPQGAFTEEIWNVKVELDGNLAQVWCDYAFYVGNSFKHCGVDAFHLFKSADGWKIFHLADTRNREGCKVPQEIQDKHK